MSLHVILTMIVTAPDIKDTKQNTNRQSAAHEHSKGEKLKSRRLQGLSHLPYMFKTRYRILPDMDDELKQKCDSLVTEQTITKYTDAHLQTTSSTKHHILRHKHMERNQVAKTQ